MDLQKGINVLSLFNGMGCIWIALDRLGIKVNKRYSCEIDKHANKVNNANYPDTIQLGDVRNVKGSDLDKIDLIVGGSPCQGFSFAGKQLNFDDPRSKLFFEFVRLMDECKPKYFLLENVKMKKEYEDVISDQFLIEPYEINSSLVSAQNRKRLYWTNIPKVGELEDKGLVLKDIIEDLPFCKNCLDVYKKAPYAPTKSRDNIVTLNPKNENGKQTWQRGRIYDIGFKSPAICSSLYDLCISKDHKTYRKLTISEIEKLQNVPFGYTNNVTPKQGLKMLGNGWTVDVIAYLLKGLDSSLKKN